MLHAVVAAVLSVGDIETMSLEELLVEDTRLELSPSLVPPGTMVGMGLGVAALGFVTLGFAAIDAQQLAKMPGRGIRDDFIGPGLISFLAGVFGVVHGIFAVSTLVVGVFWLPSRMNEAELAAAQRERVQARLAPFKATPEAVDRVRLAARQLDIIDEAYPSYALPGQLIIAGALTFTAGMISAATMHDTRASLGASLAELAAGGAAIGLGSWILDRYGRRRDDLDARRSALREIVDSAF